MVLFYIKLMNSAFWVYRVSLVASSSSTEGGPAYAWQLWAAVKKVLQLLGGPFGQQLAQRCLPLSLFWAQTPPGSRGTCSRSF